MHFEILVEDQSGRRLLDVIVPKIIGPAHTCRVCSYKGVGRIPKNMRDTDQAQNRILLENLPKLLKGYGRTHAGYQDPTMYAVVVVCDLDRKCFKEFRTQLQGILNACNPKPQARFCIAIEEGEAWFLGDLAAIGAVYPQARLKGINEYIHDSICGTWEVLADALYKGGASALREKGWMMIGAEKAIWADKISPQMNVDENASPSFCYFRDKLRELLNNR